jgi:predicted nuclease with TOPRIM domain
MSCENHAEMNKKHEEHQRQIEALAVRVSKLEQESARYDEKIDRIFADIDDIKILLAQISASIESLKAKPAKQWDVLIGALIAGGAGYFLSQVIK